MRISDFSGENSLRGITASNRYLRKMKRALPKREYFRWKQTGWEDKLAKIYNELNGNLDLIEKRCQSEGLTVDRERIRKKINELIKKAVLKPTPEWNAHLVQVCALFSFPSSEKLFCPGQCARLFQKLHEGIVQNCI